MLLAIILVIISVYLILHIWHLDVEFHKKERVNLKNGYHIPAIFWHDYNNITIKIYTMKEEDLDRVKYLIDEFEDKYAQYIDLKIYNERMAQLLEDFRRKQFFLTNKAN